MKQIKIIAFFLMLLPLAASAQEERIDTVIPKFLSNGYFFREMPQLPSPWIATSAVSPARR